MVSPFCPLECRLALNSIPESRLALRMLTLGCAGTRSAAHYDYPSRSFSHAAHTKAGSPSVVT
eukprot:3205192-Rhodomonas_salina.1